MKTFKLLSLLALVFLAGTVTGVVATRAVVRHVVREAVADPEKVQTFIERSLSRRLRLDGAQRLKLHEIVSDARGQFKEVRQQYRPQMILIFSNADSQITALLTPGQLERYENLKQENRLLLPAASH